MTDSRATTGQGTTGDNTVVATKQDISMLMDQMGRLYDANARWKDEVIQTIDERIEGKMKGWKKEIVHEFKIIAEDMRHDYLGITQDTIVEHDKRLTRLERHTGLVAA